MPPAYQGGTVDKLEFGQHDSKLFVNSGSSVSVWDLKQSTRIPATKGVRGAALSPDGQMLAIGQHGLVQVQRVRKLTTGGTQAPRKEEYKLDEGVARRLTFDSAGERVVAIVETGNGRPNKLSGWVLSTDEEFTFDSPPSDPTFAAFDNERNRLVVVERSHTGVELSESISIWKQEHETWKRQRSFEVSQSGTVAAPNARVHTEQVLAIAINSGGDLVATASADDSVRIWNISEKENADDGSVAWIRKANGQLADTTDTTRPGHTADVTCVAFANSKGSVNVLLTGSADGTAMLWGLIESKVAYRQRVEAFSAISDVAFSRDGSRFTTVGTDHNVFLWDAVNGELLGAFPHISNVATPVFCTEPAALLTAEYLTESQEVQIHDWNLTSTEGVDEMTEYCKIVAAQTHDPSGQYSTLHREQLQELRIKFRRRSTNSHNPQ